MYEEDVITERVKSQVSRRKGRGFKNQRDFGVEKLESLDNSSEEPSVMEQRSIEGWILIIGGLHEETSEEHVDNEFGKYGAIKNLHLNVDRRTGFVKGYALVEYETYQEAKNAIDGMHNQELLGCKITVSWAFVKPPFSTSESDHRHKSRNYPKERSGYSRKNHSPSP